MGVSCCRQSIVDIYPIEISLINSMNAFKIRRYSLETIRQKLEEIFEKSDDSEKIKQDLRILFLEFDSELNDHFVIQNCIFDLFISFIDELAIEDILILLFPLLNDKENKFAFEKLISDALTGDYSYRQLEFYMKKIYFFYTRELNTLLKNKLDDQDLINSLEQMERELFSVERINYFIHEAMNKKQHEASSFWDEKIKCDELNDVIILTKIWDYQSIRENLLNK